MLLFWWAMVAPADRVLVAELLAMVMMLVVWELRRWWWSLLLVLVLLRWENLQVPVESSWSARKLYSSSLHTKNSKSSLTSAILKPK